MSDGSDGQLQLDTIPNWLKTPAAGEQPASPVAVPPDPAAAWLAPDDRTHPEPGAIAEAMQTAAKAWAGPTVGEPIPGGPDPAPAPIREPGDDPAPEDQPEEGEEGEGDPLIETIAEGILLFKRLWLWPAGTQNELDAAREFSAFIIDVVKEHKANGNQPQ
jgi:hypothetical protein